MLFRCIKSEIIKLKRSGIVPNVIKLVEKHKALNIRNNMGSFYFIKMLTRIKKCVVAFAIKC